MRVSSILTIVLFLIALLGSIFGTSYYYIQTNKVVTEQIYSHLESVAQSRGNHIETMLGGQIEKIKIAATHQELLNDELKEISNINKKFYEIFVLDSNGKIIASSDESNIGLDMSTDNYFIKGKVESYFKDVYKSELTGKNSFDIATPFNEGVLVSRIETTILNDITLDKTGIGETGEVYLVNSEGYAITPLLFVEDAVLEWKIDTINSRDCIGMLNNPMGMEQEHIGHEAITTFLDYRGEKVIGAHYHIPGVEWCLLVEIDEEEILGSRRVLFQKTSLTIIITITILVTLIGFVVGKFIDNRVVLKKGGKRL